MSDAAPDAAGAAASPAWHALLQPQFDALGAGRAADVVVADGWCRFWVTHPGSPTDGLDALRNAAAARGRALYELNPADWVIEANWRADRPFLCCALPQDLLAALRTLAQARQVQLHRIQPQALHAWQRTGPAPAGAAPLWVCSVSSRTVLSFVLDGGQLQQVRHSWLGEACDDAAVDALLRDQAAQLGRPAPQAVWRLPGAGPASCAVAGSAGASGGAIQIDFSRTALPGEPPPHWPMGPLERSVLVAALLLLGGAWATGQALDPGPPAIDALPFEAVTDGTGPPTDMDPPALHEACALAHFPWLGVLDTLAAGLTDGVEVATLELRATDARLRLGLRAGDTARALHLAERLTRHPGLAALRVTQQDRLGLEGSPAAWQLSLEGPLPVAAWRAAPAPAALGAPSGVPGRTGLAGPASSSEGRTP